MREPHCGQDMLLLSDPLWRTWQDIRCIFSKCVYHYSHISNAATHIIHCCVVPNPVLGGVTTFLFASVVTSGLRVLSYNRFTRRERFILAAALSFGVGDLLVPSIFTYLFEGVNNPSNALQGFFNAIVIILSTPCE